MNAVAYRDLMADVVLMESMAMNVSVQLDTLELCVKQVSNLNISTFHMDQASDHLSYSAGQPIWIGHKHMIK